MRTHTTYTELRRILHLHNSGMNLHDISQEVFIDENEVARVIAIRTKKKRKKAQPKIVKDETPESEQTKSA